MSFSCPHLDMAECLCMRLKTDCVPGRPGCVLPKNIRFAIPVEERLRMKAEEKAERARRQAEASRVDGLA